MCVCVCVCGDCYFFTKERNFRCSAKRHETLEFLEIMKFLPSKPSDKIKIRSV